MTKSTKSTGKPPALVSDFSQSRTALRSRGPVPREVNALVGAELADAMSRISARLGWAIRISGEELADAHTALLQAVRRGACDGEY